jgi:hypothetical protein
MNAFSEHLSLVPSDAAGKLTRRRDREAYLQAARDDAAWFAERPLRRLRLRKAVRAERLLYGPPTTHMLVEQMQPGARFRRPACWTIPGPLPDDDVVLGRLLAGSMFTDEEGRA